MVYIIKRRSLFWDYCKAIVKGIGFFVPAFLFSLLFTIPWAKQYWAGEAQAPLGGIVVSFYIGVPAAMVCTICLLVKVYLKDSKAKMRESMWLNEDDDPKHRSGEI
jgi:hypothetical protein